MFWNRHRNKRPVRLPPYQVRQVVSTLSQTMNWGIQQLNIPQTWSQTMGEDVTVCIIDTGAPITSTNGRNTQNQVHPDLVGAIEVDKCRSFVPDEGIEDGNSHSTMCCGIVGAQQNHIGCVGYAPKCKIVTYKALSNDGNGELKWVTDALEAACELKPDIVSMSLGSPIPHGPMERAIIKLMEMNIPVVTAAGNGGEAEGILYPAKYKETFSIGAYDKNGNIANFSAIGDENDFALPGVDIYSTYLKNSYSRASGTSFACPACAGILALLISKHKKQERETGKNDCKTVADMKWHLIKHSIDKGIMGKDSAFGYGIIDVEKLLLNDNNNEEHHVTEPKPVVEIHKSWFTRLIDFFKSLFKFRPR